ncbi:hypothetical protein B0J17DRAFT_684811 [Rhizoctonia solani]|nr:hypothetical protein B0J17DRAFT_684811 [Rhizoctonia solani]
MENGVIIGRNRGSVFQLLAPRSVNVLSTLQFIHSLDPIVERSARMYTHVCYDDRLRTLWIVNSERSSLIAVQVVVVLDNLDADVGEVHGAFEKVAEFPTPVPIDGLIRLPGRDAQDSSLTVVSNVLQETRVDLLTIDQLIFEDSLRTLSSKPQSKLKPEVIRGVSPSLEGNELRQILDPPTTCHYFEPEDQSISPPLKTVLNPSNPGTDTTRPADIARPKEMVRILRKDKDLNIEQATSQLARCLHA